MDSNSPTKSAYISDTGAQSPQLTPVEAENWGDVWTVGTGADSDVPVEQVLEALRECARAGLPAGLDTEYTSDLSKSNYSRARVHVASLGIPGETLCMGLPVAQRVVVDRSAIHLFARWLGSKHPKLLYNAPADLHALENMGLQVATWHDLLPLSRYLAPDHKDHSLKYHIQHTLKYQGQGEYRDHFYRFKLGAKGQVTKAKEPIPLSELVPGHPQWPKLVSYAALDAKATVELGLRWSKQYGVRY